MSLASSLDLYPAITNVYATPCPEQQLIFCSARLDLSAENKKYLSGRTSRDTDWDKLLSYSDIYRTGPFLYRHLQDDEAVPGEVLSELREVSAASLSADMRTLEYLKELDEIFKRSGIPYVLFKGAHLMLEVYGVKGFRIFTDIDILVREFDMDRVDRVLSDNGFRAEYDHTQGSYRVHAMYGKGEFCLDVHAGIFGRKLRNDMLDLDIADLIKRKRTVEYEGKEYPVLGIEDALMGLCLHISCQHGYIGLIWFTDIHEYILAHMEDIDWDAFLKLAYRHRVKKPLYYSLLFTEGLFQTPIPKEVMANLSDGRGKLDDAVLNKIRSSNSEMDYLAELFMFDSLRDTAGFILLSLIRQPFMFLHFLTIFGKLIKQLTTNQPRELNPRG